MSFIHPSYLWGLFGMLLPIAIHLWNKKKGKVIKVGSITLISESTSKKSSSIQFNELLLLFIRLVVISLLVIIIAQPIIQKSRKETVPITYLVEPTLIANNKVISLLDTLSGDYNEVRLLKKGFPKYRNEVITSKKYLASYWQLIPEMQNLHTDSIVVFTEAKLSEIKGQRPTSNKNISWVFINSDTIQKKNIRALQKNDSIEIVSILSNALKTSFEKKVIAKKNFHQETLEISVHSMNTIHIGVFYEESLEDQVKFIEVVGTTLSKYLQRPIKVQSFPNKIVPDDIMYDLIVWFREDSLPKIEAKKLVYQPDPLADKLVMSGDTNSVFLLTTRLTMPNSIEQHFSEQFLEILGINQNILDSIKVYDQRSISLEELKPSYVNDVLKESKSFESIAISKWLWLFLLLILITERIVSKYKEQ